jgi:hypothetical protein
MRKVLALALTMGALTIPVSAAADPDFGPGNSSKGPHDGKCHEAGHGTGPGANEPVPGCKGT